MATSGTACHRPRRTATAPPAIPRSSWAERSHHGVWGAMTPSTRSAEEWLLGMVNRATAKGPRVGEEKRQPDHRDPAGERGQRRQPLPPRQGEQQRHERGRPRLGIGRRRQGQARPDRVTPGHRVQRRHREAQREQIVEVREVRGQLGPHGQEQPGPRTAAGSAVARSPAGQQPPHPGQHQRAGQRHGRHRGDLPVCAPSSRQRRDGQGQRADLQVGVSRVELEPGTWARDQQQLAALGEEVPGLAGLWSTERDPGRRPRPQQPPRPGHPAAGTTAPAGPPARVAGPCACPVPPAQPHRPPGGSLNHPGGGHSSAVPAAGLAARAVLAAVHGRPDGALAGSPGDPDRSQR